MPHQNNQGLNPSMSNTGWKDIENENKIAAAPSLMPNNLLKVTFTNGKEVYLHPDCLYELMEEYADDENIIWPLGDYDEDGLSEDDGPGEIGEEEDIDL